jgi:transposase-like protein
MRAVSATVAAGTFKDGRKRQFRSKQERRQIVEETLKPGASVSLVARAYDVNANQVFKWRNPIPVGGRGLTPPSVLTRVEPQYTEAARRARCQGTSVLNVVIKKDGTVDERTAGMNPMRCTLKSALWRASGTSYVTTKGLMNGHYRAVSMAMNYWRGPTFNGHSRFYDCRESRTANRIVRALSSR